jgi:hypothetical protein
MPRGARILRMENISQEDETVCQSSMIENAYTEKENHTLKGQTFMKTRTYLLGSQQVQEHKISTELGVI